MSKNRSVTPHDHYFKLLMESQENVAEMIKSTFPAKILVNLDLESLKNKDTTFVDGKSGSFQADVVYECNYGKSGKVTISLLLEHKSYKESYPHLQLLRYMLGIWEKEKKNGLELRPIIPVIFYHGPGKWPYRPFEEYFAGGNPNISGEESGEEAAKELQAFLPTFDYIFLDLQEKGDDWISENIGLTGLRISFLVMRNIRSKDLISRLTQYMEGWEELIEDENGWQEFEEIFLYLIRCHEGLEEEIRESMDRETFRNMPNPVGSIAWHMEQRFKAEGKEEGKAEGIELGKAEGKKEAAMLFAKKLIEKRFEVEEISQMTELDAAEVEALMD